MVKVTFWKGVSGRVFLEGCIGTKKLKGLVKLSSGNLYIFITPNQEQLRKNATTDPWQELAQLYCMVICIGELKYCGQQKVVDNFRNVDESKHLRAVQRSPRWQFVLSHRKVVNDQFSN
jgi:hypothetical protein